MVEAKQAILMVELLVVQVCLLVFCFAMAAFVMVRK